MIPVVLQNERTYLAQSVANTLFPAQLTQHAILIFFSKVFKSSRAASWWGSLKISLRENDMVQVV